MQVRAGPRVVGNRSIKCRRRQSGGDRGSDDVGVLWTCSIDLTVVWGSVWGFTYEWANSIYYDSEHPAKQGWRLLWIKPKGLGLGASMVARRTRNIALACSQELLGWWFSGRLASRE